MYKINIININEFKKVLGNIDNLKINIIYSDVSNGNKKTICNITDKEDIKYMYALYDKLGKAMFDARCFNIPKEEVANLIYWRQLDATRNSIQMVGQANFSHKELQNKTCNMIQDMLMTQKGINWNDFPVYQKRGSCCIKETYCPELGENNTDSETSIQTARTQWVIDKEIPIFKGDNRAYIENLIFVGEE